MGKPETLGDFVLGIFLIGIALFFILKGRGFFGPIDSELFTIDFCYYLIFYVVFGLGVFFICRPIFRNAFK